MALAKGGGVSSAVRCGTEQSGAARRGELGNVRRSAAVCIGPRRLTHARMHSARRALCRRREGARARALR